jgi:hypothetical protein
MGLRIEVHEKDSFPENRQAGTDVRGGSGLSNPSFLIDHCDDFHAKVPSLDRIPKPIDRSFLKTGASR